MACKRDDSNENRAHISGYSLLEQPNVKALSKALKVQPVTVAVEVRRSFQSYKRGVYSEVASCGSRLNHAVLATG